MRKLPLTLAASLMIMIASQAEALTLENCDAENWLITINETGQARLINLKANQTVGDICLDGCSVQMENGEAIVLDGSETVYVEDGELVVSE